MCNQQKPVRRPATVRTRGLGGVMDGSTTTGTTASTPGESERWSYESTDPFRSREELLEPAANYANEMERDPTLGYFELYADEAQRDEALESTGTAPALEWESVWTAESGPTAVSEQWEDSEANALEFDAFTPTYAAGQGDHESVVGSPVDVPAEAQNLGSHHPRLDSFGDAFLGEFLLESAVADRQLEYSHDDHESSVAGETFEVEFLGFGGSEHKAIGDTGSRQAKTALVYGAQSKPLTFGDVVALAGDMYGSYYDLAERSRSQAGRAELEWALWFALAVPNAPEPNISQSVKNAVTDRYYSLAAENISHFSAGGTAAQHYMKWHAAALADALAAGQSAREKQWRFAVGKEAFADHFLTDVFSAGHVRTPRAQIKDWYRDHGIGASAAFVSYMAAFMFERLRAGNTLLKLPFVGSLARSIVEKKVRALGGEALQSFSLADVVSLALHNFDNCGLFVVSALDPNGRAIPGGYHWRAIGDGHLRQEWGLGRDTQRMVTAAVAASLRDLEVVRDQGRRLSSKHLSPPQQAQAIKTSLKGAPFHALGFIPKEDRSQNNPPLTQANGRAPLEWRWGELGDIAYRQVDATVKGEIATELAAKVPLIQDPAKGPLGVEIHGVRAALQAFVQHLRTDGIGALEKAVGRRAR